MSEKLTPAALLARLPGWERAAVSPLSGGLMNRSYRVEAGERQAVLKIDDELRAPPLNSRAREAAIQTAAAAAGIASTVLHHDENSYLTEYVRGDVCTAEDLKRHSQLEDLAAALQTLHALPRSGRTFDAAQAARGYVARTDGKQQAQARRLQRIVASAAAPQKLCLCHNDLVAANIINARRVVFIDWEFACDNDPLFDLATVIAHHELDESRAAHLLAAYFGSGWREHRAALAEQMQLYDALRKLWQLATSCS